MVEEIPLSSLLVSLLSSPCLVPLLLVFMACSFVVVEPISTIYCTAQKNIENIFSLKCTFLACFRCLLKILVIIFIFYLVVSNIVPNIVVWMADGLKH